MDVMIEEHGLDRGQGKLEALTFKLGLSGGKKREAGQREDNLGVGRERRFGEWSEDRGLSLVRGETQSERWAR